MKVSAMIRQLERAQQLRGDVEVLVAHTKTDILNSEVFVKTRDVDEVEAEWSAYHEAWQAKDENGDCEQPTEMFIVIWRTKGDQQP